MLRITRISVHFFGVIWHVRLVILLMFLWLLVGAAAIAYFEEISFGEAIYFSFVTGLTIGYGDIVAKTAVGRLVAVLIGFIGVLFTGLVIAAVVETIRSTYQHSEVSD